MKIFCVFLSLFLMFLSCKNAVVDTPKNLIDDDTMVDIFYDLSILDASRNASFGNGTTAFVANDYIFKKYKIDSLQFAQSNKYYAADVAKYKRMYKIVRDRLNDKRDEMNRVDTLKK